MQGGFFRLRASPPTPWVTGGWLLDSAWGICGQYDNGKRTIIITVRLSLLSLGFFLFLRPIGRNRRCLRSDSSFSLFLRRLVPCLGHTKEGSVSGWKGNRALECDGGLLHFWCRGFHAIDVALVFPLFILQKVMQCDRSGDVWQVFDIRLLIFLSVHEW